MKNKHPKRKMAEAMLSREERRDGVSPFNGVAWTWRQRDIKERLAKAHA